MFPFGLVILIYGLVNFRDLVVLGPVHTLGKFKPLHLSVIMSTHLSGLFSVVLRHIDFKFGIWICLEVIQVKFDFCRVWPCLTWLIALCSKSVFRTFLCYPLKYSLQIWYMNLSWGATGILPVGDFVLPAIHWECLLSSIFFYS